MPEYTFRCRKCGEVQTFNLGMEEKRPQLCTLNRPYHITAGAKTCNGGLERIFDAPGIIYRAGGFQTTDDRLDPKEDDYDAYDV